LHPLFRIYTQDQPGANGDTSSLFASRAQLHPPDLFRRIAFRTTFKDTQDVGASTDRDLEPVQQAHGAFWTGAAALAS